MRIVGLALVFVGCGGTSDDEPSGGGAGLFAIETGTTDTSSAGQDFAGNSIEDALAIDLYDFGTIYYGMPIVLAEETLNPAGDRDFYVLEGTAGRVWQFYTSSYALNGYEVIADTVIRVYDEDGNMIVENDDMPYRFWETDSGVYVTQTWNGPLYVEVLEFGDWAGLGANGGPDFTYELIAVLPFNNEAEPNDSVAEAIATYDAAAADPYDDIYGPFWASEYNGGYAIEMWGQCGDDDVDYYAIKADEESDGQVWQWSIWPGSTGDMDAQMSLYDEGGNLLAQTSGTSAQIDIDYPFLWDAGITYPVVAGRYYTVAFSNLTPGSASSWYTGIQVQYLPLGEYEFEPNDSSGSAQILSMEENEYSLGDYFVRAIGSLAVDDPADVFVVSNALVNGLDGRYLSMWVHAQEAGSFLDPHVLITQDDTTLADLASSAEGNGGDVEIVDLLLGDNNDIEIEITADSNTSMAEQNTWFLYVYVSASPIGN